jgi:CHRD domain-containing protein
MKRGIAIVMGIAFAGGLALAACAQQMSNVKTYHATLSGAQEVPPNKNTGTGTIDVTYDPATKTLSWKGSYAGLTGPVVAAHFHGDAPPSPPAPNSKIEVPVTATSSPFQGSATLTDAQAADLMAGKWYFNIHTAQNKGGEIRGLIKAGM